MAFKKQLKIDEALLFSYSSLPALKHIRIRAAVFNSSSGTIPLCMFCMHLLLLKTFVLFDRKCPVKWISGYSTMIPVRSEAVNVYVTFKGH